MPLNPKEVEFRKATRKALKDWEDYKEDQLRQARKALKEYRNEVVAQFAGVTDWQKYQHDRVLKALNETSRNIGYQISRKWETISNEVTALALAGVDDPLGVLGLPTKMLPVSLPVQKLAILNSYVPSLIVDVTDEAHKKVAGLMRQGLLGGINQQEILKKVGDVVGPLKPGKPRGPDTIFSATERRVSTIMRTEMNQIHDLVKNTRRADLAEKYPGVGSQWLHRDSPHPRASHAALDGQVIFPAKGEKFNVAGIMVDGPHDLELPAGEKINCHCTTITVYEPDQDAKKAAAESPYIPGDGSDIPTAKLPPKQVKKLDPVQPVGPKKLFNPANADDPIIGKAHNAGMNAWGKVKDPKAAQAAYDSAYKESLLSQAKKEALEAEHQLGKTNPGLQAKLEYHKTKAKILEAGGVDDMVAIEKAKIDDVAKAIYNEKYAAAKNNAMAAITDADAMAFDSPAVQKMKALYKDPNVNPAELQKAVSAAEKEALAHKAEIAKMQSSNAAAALKKEEEFLNLKKTWDQEKVEDLFGGLQKPTAVKNMGPVQKVEHFQDELADARWAFNNTKAPQGSSRWLRLQKDVSKYEAELDTARKQAARFFKDIQGLNLSEAEVIHLQQVSLSERLNLIKEIKKGNPILSAQAGGGPRPPAMPDWQAIKRQATVQFGQRGTEATRYWERMKKFDTEDCRYGAMSYQGAGYKGMNNHLRKGARATAGIKEDIAMLDKAFDGRFVMADDTILYRGIGSDVQRILKVPAARAEAAVGTTIRDMGYISTSLDSTASFSKEVYAEIFVRKGAKVTHFNWTGAFKGEREVLLPRGTEFFVHAVERKPNGKIKLYLEALI